MNRSRVIKRLTPLILCIFWGVAHAEANLYLFVFKSGIAQKNISVSVGDVHKTTDSFGLASFTLPAGEYEIGYSRDGELFALTDVNLPGDQQSQIFLNLSSGGPDVELDLPITAYKQNFEHNRLKQQQGPKGTLKLQLLDNRTQLPVSGAKLYFKGYAVEATSNEDGMASLELAAGTYDISIIHPKYVMRVMKDVSITAAAVNEQTSKLVKADIVMKEFVVSAPSVEGSLASSLADLKDSEVFADAISSEQFSKSGDSSAASALKRVTGITIVNNKYVYIRGLGERYSTVLLNDLHVPSPELTKRVVPLDIFPTSVIQEMEIQKTYSSNLPGTFAGGTVLIKTKDIPKEDNYIKAEIGMEVNDDTGKSVVYNPDNDRPLPSLILKYSDNFGVLTEEVKIGSTVIAEGLTAQEKETLNKAMVNYRRYGLERKTLKPGKNARISLGQSFKTSGGIKYGIAGSIYYKTTEEAAQAETNDYQYSPTSGDNLHIQNASNETTVLDEKYGGLASLGVDNQKGQALKYTLLTLNESEDTTVFGLKEKLVEGTYHERTFLQYTETQLTAHQLNGRHRFGESSGGLFDDVVVEWGAETAKATRLEPGTFEYEYKDAGDDMVIDAKKLFYLYSDLTDEVDNYRVDFTLPFEWSGRPNHTKFGIFDYTKSRSLDNRRFKIKYDDTLDPRPIDEALSESSVDNGTLDVLDSYKPDDFYTAKQSVTAFYISQLFSPLENLDLAAGLRQENSTQELRVGQQKEVYKLDTSDLLPALNVTWRFNNEHQMRLAYSSTLSRPDFREFSPNRYKDPQTGNIIYGYEKLKYTTINNLDLKYEWYPSFDEFFSIALFGKNFLNPIETVRTISDVEIETSYRNAQSARSLGFEIGFRNNLENILDSLKYYYVSGNYTFINSQIRLDKGAPENKNDQFIPFLTTEKRPMQGQSPYVVNLQMGYDNFFTRRSAVLLYNVFGERIHALGINGNPDIYEQPFHKLDFVVKWGLNDTYDEQVKKIGYSIKFKAENLLDSAVTMKQGDKDVLIIHPGRFYSLKFAMKF